MTIPRVLARSVISRAKLTSTMRAEVEGVDVLFSDNGPFGPDRKFPHWKFADLDSAIPDAATDILELGIPVLYGECSDEGATDPKTGNPAAKGMLPGFYLGKFAIGDATPAPFQYRMVGGGGGAGSGSLAGGGGGGSVVSGTVAMVVGGWTITVGAAGAANTNGGNSSFDTDSAPGGGHGGQAEQPGASGGNGGGAGTAQFVGSGGDLGRTNDWQSKAPGSGTFGHPGGADNINAGSGGGGAGGDGGAASQNNGGNGGAGFASDWLGAVDYLGAGGPGAGLTTVGTLPPCSYGRGGSADGVNGAQPGVVFVRYATGACTATGGTVTESGGWTIHTFTSGGTFVITSVSSATVPTPPGPSPGRTLPAVVALLQASVTAHTTDADWGAIIGHSQAAALEAAGTVPTTYAGLASIITATSVDAMLNSGSTAPDDELTGNVWGFLAFGLGAWWQYLGIYASDLGAGVADAQHNRVKMDIDSRDGVDFLVPGWPSWPYTAPYVQFINDAGDLFNVTGIFVRGPILKDHIAGTVNITANAIGTEDVGDGSGLPIVQVHKIEQHLIENHLIRQSRGGLWVTATDYPQFEDGTPMVKSSSFTAAQNITIASLGSLGLTGAYYTDTEQQSTTDVLAKFMEWTDSRTGISADGQVMKFRIDPSADPTTWPRIDHVVEVFGGVTRTAGEDRENVLQASCDWDPDGQKFRIGPIPKTNDAAIRRWKNRRKQGDPHENKLLRTLPELLWVVERRLVRLGVGSILVEASGPIGWLDYDIGTGVQFNSEDGPGPNGYVDQPMIIVRRSFDIGSRKVTLTLWDVADILTETAALG